MDFLLAFSSRSHQFRRCADIVCVPLLAFDSHLLLLEWIARLRRFDAGCISFLMLSSLSVGAHLCSFSGISSSIRVLVILFATPTLLPLGYSTSKNCRTCLPVPSFPPVTLSHRLRNNLYQTTTTYKYPIANISKLLIHETGSARLTFFVSCNIVGPHVS